MASRGCGGFFDEENRCVNSRGCEQYDHLPDDSAGSSGGLCESRQNDDDLFLFRIGKGAFGKEDVRDVTEQVRESELVTMVQGPIYRAGKKVSKVDKGDRPRKSNMSGICSSKATDQPKSGHRKRNSVTFNSEVTIHLIPYEDRKSEWMQRAIDRCHFQRRCLKNCFLLCDYLLYVFYCICV